MKEFIKIIESNINEVKSTEYLHELNISIRDFEISKICQITELIRLNEILLQLKQKEINN